MASDFNCFHQDTERNLLAVKASQDGLWDWDLVHDEIYFSPQWKALLGVEESSHFGTTLKAWLGRVHPEDLEPFELKIEDHLQGKSPYFEVDYRIYTDKGYFLWVWARGQVFRDDQGNPVRFIGLQTDISERKTREQQYIHDAFHDPLTNLPNRALFFDRLNQALLSRLPFAVMYMDLDKFKFINDKLGHQVGDELLTLVAQRLVKCSRGGDTIARFGGDEFVLLISNLSSLAEVIAIAKRVLHETSQPFLIEDHKISTQLSIGITMGSSLNYKSPEEVLRDADIALYQAKKVKGYVIFDDTFEK